MSEALSQADLARRLGVDPSTISRDKRRGMPVHSVDAAQRWRARHLHPALAKLAPAKRAEVAPDGSVPLLEALLLEGCAALEAGTFQALAPAIRRAMRKVPVHLRHACRIPFNVMDALVAPVVHAICGVEPACGDGALDPAEAELMGRFWWSVAADEPVDLTPFGIDGPLARLAVTNVDPNINSQRTIT